ncbi:MAG TPA: N-formylglutamate amidohydrolase [Pedobacter sp.]|jgi:N-formylglutamate amidohydrolase
MKKLILHIPHASIKIPHYDGFIIGAEKLELEILKLTDWYTDDLFGGTDDVKVKADFSRVFCDVERFSDDAIEEMAEYGMGVTYTATDAGEPLRYLTAMQRQHILDKYYWTHHKMLNDAVSRSLSEHGEALIIDCHSYSNQPFKRDLNQVPNRPDYCIGTDDFHTSQKLIDACVEFFNSRDLSLGVNKPYGGTIVPLQFYKKNRNVQSVMLEVNRKLYLHDCTCDRSPNYNSTKEVVKEFIIFLREESNS